MRIGTRFAGWRLAARGALLALVVVGLWGQVVGTGGAFAQPTSGRVVVVQVEGEIEGGLAAYISRVVGGAEKDGAAAVVLRINTPGGRLDSALDIKDTLLDSQVPTIALVDRQAFSAGALIAVAAHEIYMVPGAVMGAATPVVGDTGEKASEKVVSAVRQDFAATAELRGRDPDVARAMVDESVEVPGLVEVGKLLTLTTSEALEWGYADGTAQGVEDLLAQKGLSSAEVVNTSPSLAEGAVRILTNPIVSSLLITLGFLGLLFELQTAGWGIGGTVGLVSLGLFFWGHMLAGLAGWEGITLVVLGIALMALEVFVIPGFGVAGVLGILAFLGGLFLSLIGDLATGAELLRAGYVIAVSLVLMLAGAWASLTFLPRTRSFRGLVLLTTLAHGERPVRARAGGGGDPDALPDLREAGDPKQQRAGPWTRSLVGVRGVAETDLRPSGTARIEGRVVDVVTQGQYVEAGTRIEIIQDEGYRRVVQPVGRRRARQK